MNPEGSAKKKQEAQKQAAYAKRGEALNRMKKELNGHRERADSERRKAAEALKVTERKLADVDSKVKKVEQELAFRSAVARRQAEGLRAQRERDVISRERAMMRQMKTDIDALEQKVNRMVQLLEGLSNRRRGAAARLAPVTHGS